VRVLLDTHALLWWILNDVALSRKARTVIEEKQNEVLVSAVCAWEIATKFRIGKLIGVEGLVAEFESRLESDGFKLLPISTHHALRAGLLGGAHKDPFDRMLIAQAQSETLAIVSKEAVFDSYGVRRIW
jgi:PIN domain nuclease of toxin-antitoxin system